MEAVITHFSSLWKKIYDYWIRNPRNRRELARKLKHTIDFQRKLGLSPALDGSSTRYNDIPKLVNNVSGIEIARKFSPLAHMVGPILRGTHPALDP